MSSQKIDKLLAQLDSEDIIKRREAAYFLGNYDDDRILPSLENFFNAEDKILRENASDAIARITKTDFGSILRKRLRANRKYLYLWSVASAIIFLGFVLGVLSGGGESIFFLFVYLVRSVLGLSAILTVVMIGEDIWRKRNK